jgi:ASC-1-like (ASCH) protein
MRTHELRLATQPFNEIQSGRKTIECRLYDEKRRAIELGDEIIFINREDSTQTLRVKVVDLLRHASFSDLYDSAAPEKFGGESKEGLMKLIRQFYSKNEEIKYGVLGIVVVPA